MKLSIGGRLKPRQISLFLFFCPKSDGQKDFMASSPIAIALRSVSPKCILTIGPLFGWLLHLSIHWKPSKIEAPSLSLFLFLRRSIRPPQMMGKRPPLHVPPGRIASLTSHPPPTPSFGWLLRLPVKWRPSKAGAPPVSLWQKVPLIFQTNEKVHLP